MEILEEKRKCNQVFYPYLTDFLLSLKCFRNSDWHKASTRLENTILTLYIFSFLISVVGISFFSKNQVTFVLVSFGFCTFLQIFSLHSILVFWGKSEKKEGQVSNFKYKSYSDSSLNFEITIEYCLNGVSYYANFDGYNPEYYIGEKITLYVDKDNPEICSMNRFFIPRYAARFLYYTYLFQLFMVISIPFISK
jgi:hypothetical protein